MKFNENFTTLGLGRGMLKMMYAKRVSPSASPSASTQLMYFDNDGGSATYVEKVITPVTEVYAEYYIRFSKTTEMGPNNSIELTVFYDSTVPQNVGRIFVITDASLGNITRMFVVGYHDGGSTISAPVNISPVANTWYKITLHWKQNTGIDVNDGIFQATFDGGGITGTAVLDNNLLEVDTLRLGATDTPDTASTDIWFDDWKAGSSEGGSQLHSDTWDASTDAGDNWDSEVNGNDLTVVEGEVT